MFGIQSFTLKVIAIILGIIIGGVVLICIGVTAGCTPNDGIELKQSQMALATKNNIDSSQQEIDNSIDVKLPEESNRQLPPTESTADETLKLVKARADERAKIILAQAELKEKIIRAQEEKWRLLVWVVGVGAFLLAIAALYIRSPLDKKGRE